MCGIVGYAGLKQAQPFLVSGLQRLEYRGYDSAGVAIVNSQKNNLTTQIIRTVGKINQLKEALSLNPCVGTVGVGHTRWATHGKPSKENAHPHHSDGITVVHNGIIENQHSLRAQLANQGFNFSSDTDTEIIAHLIANKKTQLKNNTQLAVQHTVDMLEGSYALAIIDENNPSQIICIRKGSPIIIGLGSEENYIASDVPALQPLTNEFIFLKNDEMAILDMKNINIFSTCGKSRPKTVKQLKLSQQAAQKDNYKHFMLKEINEQPTCIRDTFAERIVDSGSKISLNRLDIDKIKHSKRIVIAACGSSYHAGMLGKYFIERIAKIPVEVDLCSEYRYRSLANIDNTLLIAISQSGETADTLAVLDQVQNSNCHFMGICNVVGSAVARICSSNVGTIYTRAGPEISVASTKSFTCQIAALYLLALFIAQENNLSSGNKFKSQINDLINLPKYIEKVLFKSDQIRNIANLYKNFKHMLFLGRGEMFPTALEGALKLKEISYIHAEGYAAGEMKHGPIALIDENMPTVALAPQGLLYQKTIANIQEIKARSGNIISIATEGDTYISQISQNVIYLPKTPYTILPFIVSVVLQLFAYHIADLKGKDVDQPRNLAKSVTVE